MPETCLTIPAGDITLEGVLDAPEGDGPFPAVVVCHPHPQYGGDMSNNVVLAAVRGLRGRGIASLRFNFRGVGRSGGSYAAGAGERDDVRAALAHAATRPEVDAARLGLAGYSFGAWMAALAVESPPATTELLASSRAAGEPAPRALALIALPMRMGPDLSGTLTAYPGPVLFVAGDQDSFCPITDLRRFTEGFGDRAETRIVVGADHFWSGYERDLEAVVGDFFARHL